jgi:hypothetical protein
MFKEMSKGMIVGFLIGGFIVGSAGLVIKSAMQRIKGGENTAITNSIPSPSSSSTNTTRPLQN